MAFREVSVVQVKEALRRWLSGDGERPIARGVWDRSQDGEAVYRCWGRGSASTGRVVRGSSPTS